MIIAVMDAFDWLTAVAITAAFAYLLVLEIKRRRKMP